MKLSESLEGALDERAAFPVGTVRKRKDGQYIKTARGDWKPVSGDPTGATKHEQGIEKTKITIDSLTKAIANGKLAKGVSLGQHIKIAKDFRKKHEAGAAKLLGDLTDIAGPGAKVKARTKNLESMLGKMVRKPKYKTADMLKDGTGARIVHDTIDEVKRTVAKIKEKYEILAEDEEDYISKPKDEGYRSHHLVIKDSDGLPKEIQIRTKNQDSWADWFHDAYKPTTPVQKKLVEKGKPVINAYAKQMADHFFAKDSGQNPGPPPPCPQIVKDAIGCMAAAA